VARCHAEGGAAAVDVGALEPAFGDGGGDVDCVTADLADGGETGVEDGGEGAGFAGAGEGGGLEGDLLEIEAGRRQCIAIAFKGYCTRS